MKPFRTYRLSLEALDDRIVPAITVSKTPAGVLNVTGFPINATLTVTQTAANQLQVNDGATSYGPYVAPTGLNMTLQRFNQAVLVDVGSLTYSGYVTIDLGLGSTASGTREVSIFDSNGLTGGLGNVIGNVTIRNGNGSEAISVGRPAALAGTDLPVQVSGNVFVTTKNSAGQDQFELVPGAIVSSNIYLTNVDKSLIGLYVPGNALAKVDGSIVISTPTPGVAFGVSTYATVQGSLTAVSSAGSTKSSNLSIGDGSTVGGLTAVLSNGGSLVGLGTSIAGQAAPIIGGDVNVTLGVGVDTFSMLNDTTDKTAAQVLGNVTVRLGEGNNMVFFDSAAFVLGSFTISGGNGNNSLGDLKALVNIPFAGTVDSNLWVTFGNGANTINFGASVFGSQVQFQTGAGKDMVSVNPTANAPIANLRIYAGAGNDTVNINSVNFFSGYIDGGLGTGDDFNTSVVIPINWTVTNFEL